MRAGREDEEEEEGKEERRCVIDLAPKRLRVLEAGRVPNSPAFENPALAEGAYGVCGGVRFGRVGRGGVGEGDAKVCPPLSP